MALRIEDLFLGMPIFVEDDARVVVQRIDGETITICHPKSLRTEDIAFADLARRAALGVRRSYKTGDGDVIVRSGADGAPGVEIRRVGAPYPERMSAGDWAAIRADIPPVAETRDLPFAARTGIIDTSPEAMAARDRLIAERERQAERWLAGNQLL